MLELSPLVTAASAPASSMPASRRRSRSKPTPWMVRPREALGQPPERLGLLVDDRDGVALVLEDARQARIRPGHTRPPRRATFAPLPGRDVCRGPERPIL